MNLFSRPISFQKIDPLDDGLREEIAEEQLEPEAIRLEDDVNEAELSAFWQSVESDIEKDPEWFKLNDDNE